jgi:hypothetical protein
MNDWNRKEKPLEKPLGRLGEAEKSIPSKNAEGISP